jgi:tetratricopeptide (TPR) repeat protein
MCKVELRRFTGEIVVTTFTRSSGEFEMNGVSNGNYYIIIEEKGYEPVREPIEILGASRIGLIFSLRKIRSEAEETGASVSVRELALPRHVRDTLRKATRALYEQRDYAASLKHLKKVQQEAPGFYEAEFLMGVAEMELGQTVSAEARFQRAIELSGRQFAEPFFALASLRTNALRFADAEQLARDGLAIDSEPWQGHYELARALLGLGKNDAARLSTEESLRRNNSYAPAYLLLSNICIRLKDYPSLVRALDEFLKLEPNGPASEQARKMRESVQAALEANKAAAAGSVKPQ